ncbi:IS1595 family transposase [Granulicella tundricola]|uniref:Unclassified family transposase n=1 Tax=Granulicella tundricola (strain ATCC BAA-1859 / DSM 23138 / MP5ACTX9) TaxID=1198114 RepID=E8WX67_GRATM|nr:IS1595 family transposase [Granulicella tundricola]ADW69709.1 unclassified family transposase [Granulicella tundricola MP5ACTX9]
MDYPKTLIEAVRYFSDEQVCIDSVSEMRWPDGKPTCCWCGKQNNTWLATQKRWKCKACRKQFSVKRGTIFEDSPLGLDKWLVAMWMLANCRNGVSSYEIARSLGITQKSAWHMTHRIREAMAPEDGSKLGGADTAVEVDESYIGGKLKNMHNKQRRAFAGSGGDNKNKSIVMGAVDRENKKVRAEVIPAAQRETMQALVQKHVKFGSTVYTDSHVGYTGLKLKYEHDFVNHMTEYVRGQVHTNGIENFWALLKRGLAGTYVSVEPEHLGRYVNEQVFRFNHRWVGKVRHTDATRFKAVLKEIVNRQLTYADLTGRSGQTAKF